jgi:hypothetical protein
MRAVIADRQPAIRTDRTIGWQAGERDHEVSILITGVDRCLGSQPAAKTSMIIMRPPQQGHGFGSVGD